MSYHQLKLYTVFSRLLTLTIILVFTSCHVFADPDWIYNPENGHTYAVVLEEMTWQQAKDYAEQQVYQGYKAHLVTITTQAEQDWIEAISPPNYRFWIGAKQSVWGQEPDGGWEWITGEPWDYTHWRSTEPNNLSLNEEVVEFCLDGWWNDMEESGPMVFIIEVGQDLPAQFHFASESVSCSSMVTLLLADEFFPANEVLLNLTTNQGDSEEIILTAQDASNNLFIGSLPVVAGSVSPFDSLLQVTHGDVVQATYEDRVGGNMTVLSASATFDCFAPVISNLEIIGAFNNQATITFNTDEPARVHLAWADSITGNFEVIETTNYTKTHQINLCSLLPETKYYYKITVEDGVSNQWLDDNQGQYYTFTTNNVDRIFSDSFEQGVISEVWEVSGLYTYRTYISPQLDPLAGERHLIMDSSTRSYARNELTLTLDLTGYQHVMLSFWAKSFNDEPNGPPNQPFINYANFDGVAFSVNGKTWYEIQSLRELTSEYQFFSIDLDAISQQYNLPYGPQCKIRFNHFDNEPVPDDGIAIDMVAVDGESIDRMKAIPPTGLSGMVYMNDPIDSMMKIYSLSNIGHESFDWEATASETWIGLSQTSGILNPGESIDVRIDVLDSIRFLPAGVYSATVDFHRQGSDIRHYREITVNVIPHLESGQYALEFNSEQYAQVLQPDLLALDSNGPFTLEAWVYPRQEGYYWKVVIARDATFIYGLTVSGDGFLQFEAGGQLNTDPGTIPFNTWTHIAGVWDGTHKKTYINGEPQTDISWTGDLFNQGDILIGATNLDGIEGWNGYIDEVRIWSKARSEDEIKDTMNRVLTTGEWPGLLANWSFSEGTGQFSFDSAQGIALGLGKTNDVDNQDPRWIGSSLPFNMPFILGTNEATEPYTNKNQVTINGQLLFLKDIASVEINDVSVAFNDTGEFQIVVNLQEGSNTITAEALNDQGVILYTSTLTLIRDTQSPLLQIFYPTQGEELFHSLPIVVSGRVEDINPATLWINNQVLIPDSNGNFTYRLNGIEEGPHQVTLYAVDPAGNRSEKVTLSILFDTPPELTILNPIDGSYVRSLKVEGRVRDILDIIDQVWINGIPVVVTDELFEFELPAFANDTYVIDVTAEDSTGNQVQDRVVVLYDQTTPELLLYRPENGQQVETAWVQALGLCFDDSPIWIKVDGKFYPVKANEYFHLNIPLQEGENSLTFILEDAAGNQSEPVIRNVIYKPGLISDRPRIYTLDGFGRVEMAESGTSSATPLQDAYLPRDMARDLELTSTGLGFWVLRDDGWIAGFGDAERYSDTSIIPVNGDEDCTPYFGWPIARDLEIYQGGSTPDSGYYILDGLGWIHTAGEALTSEFPEQDERPYFGWDIARRIKIMNSQGYYLLDGFGGIHAVGDVPNFPQRTPYWGWDIARDFEIIIIQDETAYVSGDIYFKSLDDYALYVLDGFGGVHTAGAGQFGMSALFEWDIAENLEVYRSETSYSYVWIDGYGGQHWTNETDYSQFPAMTEPGFDIMRDIELFGMEPSN